MAGLHSKCTNKDMAEWAGLYFILIEEGDTRKKVTLLLDKRKYWGGTRLKRLSDPFFFDGSDIYTHPEPYY